MRHKVQGGAIVPAVIETGRQDSAKLAQPVFNAASSPRKMMGGAAQPIIEITSDDLTINGGQYRLAGGPAIPMSIVTGRKQRGGPAQVVYPVDANGAYDPSFAGYIYKVLNPDSDSGYDPSSLIQFLPQNELTGAVSIDYSGLNHDGAYTGVTLGQPGVPGMGMTSPFYDGTNDYNDIHSAALAAAFNGVAGTYLLWLRVNAVGVWTDGAIRYLFRLQANANNYIRVWKHSNPNTIVYNYAAGAVVETVTKAGVAETGWMVIAITWDKAAGVDGQVIAYYGGIQEGAIQTGLGVWAGALTAGVTVIGAATTVPANVWHGWSAPSLLYTEALTQPAIAYLSAV